LPLGGVDFISQSSLYVESKNLTKSYGHTRALNGVTLTIKPGEKVAVLGHNGAGKTTFLKVISTQITSYTGSVKMFELDPKKSLGEIRKSTGFMGHVSFLYDELTVEENLNFYGKMFDLDKNQLKERIDKLLELMKIERWQHVQVKFLSHGLRKRVDIARVFLHSPLLLVLDEPFSGLDEATVDLFIEQLKYGEKKALVLSSHSPELTERVCNRTIFFDHGKPVKDF
jgi:ABC-type multidrug transport system ATPase subunit